MCSTVTEKENLITNLFLGCNQKVNFVYPRGLEKLLRAIDPSAEGPERHRTTNFMSIEIQRCP